MHFWPNASQEDEIVLLVYLSKIKATHSLFASFTDLFFFSLFGFCKVRRHFKGGHGEVTYSDEVYFGGIWIFNAKSLAGVMGGEFDFYKLE